MNGYQPASIANNVEDSLYLIADGGDELLAPVSGGLFWQADDSKTITELASAKHFVGHYQGRSCWVWHITADVDSNTALRVKLRSLLCEGEELFQLVGRAQQLVRWYRNHRYCSRCGTPTVLHDGDLAMACESCGEVYYPRISPCAIMLITRGDECLLARHVRHDSFFSCLAGFVEAGESVEQAVRRECMEEVGVEVGALHYHGSQPWPFPGQLMIGFHADYQGGDITPDVTEIAEAGWFRYDQLPACPSPETLSGQLIASFVARCRERAG